MQRKRFLKRSALALLSLILLVSFSGCSNLGTELVDLMIIQGIGVDRTNKGYRVTIEAINNTQNAFSNGQSSSETISKKYSSEGASIAEALEDAVKVAGKEPLYAHNRVLIIGEKTAEGGLWGVLDFFVRDYNARPTVLIAIAKDGTAGDMIDADLGSDTLTSQQIENILIQSNKNSIAYKQRLFETVNAVIDETQYPCIPAVKLEKDGDKSTVELSGTAVFDKQDRLIGYMNEEETFGSLIMNNKTEKGLFKIELEDSRSVVLKIFELKTKTDVSYSDSGLKVIVNVKAYCNIVEYDSKNFENSGKILDEITEEAEKSLVAASEKSIGYAKNKKSDIFRYGRRLWLADFDSFSLVKNDWQNEFCNSQITVNADVIIRKTGEEALM